MKIRTELPGVVVSHHVDVGQRVEPNQLVATVETMKLENGIRATAGGRLLSLAPIGSLLEPGGLIADIVPNRRPPDTPTDMLRIALASATHGRFREMDLDQGELATVKRSVGSQDSGIVVGEISHRIGGQTVRRVWLCGDSQKQLGAVSEPECRRIIAAIDYAEKNNLPLEWIALSAGAKVSLDSGTENMDWCALVVRRIIEFTQSGGQIIVVVAGANVGAQAYWNASATMLLHCAGMLIMVDGSAMVLTGAQALARSGGVPAESDQAMGGYHEIMGPNGQAHRIVPDLHNAYELITLHHDLLSRRTTVDPRNRDICQEPLEEEISIGDVLRASSNPTRKQPYPVRGLMTALRDSDSSVLERWPDMSGAEGVISWDTFIGGNPVTLLGIESRPVPNSHDDGPAVWSGCTLYPDAAKKVARSITHASNRRPVVVLANLSGFDGSAWSLRNLQLEWGAEIARAVINFVGRIVVVITGRFHGGAYVVFNKSLNDNLRMIALEGTKVSVIGGSSAAEVVLKKDVENFAQNLAGDNPCGSAHRVKAREEIAASFDEIHSVARAFEMGSVDAIVPPEELRSAVIDELEIPLATDPKPQPAGSRGSLAQVQRQRLR